MNPDLTPTLTRRMLLKSTLSALCPLSAAVYPVVAEPDTLHSLYISGARLSADQYAAVVFDDTGKLYATVPLIARAHGAASHADSQRACIFGRRPGLFMNTFDIRKPEQQRSTEPAGGRHFYGHGAYSAGGDLLYATENDFENASGVIGIYDATRGYQRIGEWDTHGIGPHEIIRIPGSDLLVIANGGIQTHPDTGREKLNLATMQPSLTIVDARNGELVGRHFLADELHQVSIRHLACTRNGELWYAGQYEGDKLQIDGLAGVVSIQQSMQSFYQGASRKGLALIDLPGTIQSRASGYLSSVAIVGQHAVFTAARGGLVFKVNRDTLLIDNSLSIVDCSGVSATDLEVQSATEAMASDESALITSGTGEIVSVRDEAVSTLAVHRLQWDNHVYRL